MQRSIWILVILVVPIVGQQASGQLRARPLEKFLSIHPGQDAEFGKAVAVHEDVLVCGAPDEDPHGFGSGAAHVFVRGEDGWGFHQYLVAPDGGVLDHLGRAVDVYGSTIVAGANGTGGGPVFQGGFVQVYERQGQAWSSVQKLTPSSAEVGDNFGVSLDLHQDTLVVGKPAGERFGRSAFVFERDTDGWHEVAELDAVSVGPAQGYGSPVALTDGWAFVRSDLNVGTVHVFRREVGGWVESGSLPNPTGASTSFGYCLAADGDTLLVGAYGEPVPGGSSGAVFVYRRSGGIWSLEAELVDPHGEALDRLGWDVALDGDIAAAGAIGAGAFDTGQTLLYTRRAGLWTLADRVLRIPPPPLGFWFGWTVALDGETLAVGDPRDDEAFDDAGALHLYALQPGAPFCFGDGELGACPCGNTSAAPGGCVNSTGAGAELAAFGNASVAEDLLRFEAAGLPAGTVSLLVLGEERLAPGADPSFGDGFLCLRGAMMRLAAASSDDAGRADFGPGLGAWPPAVQRRFQVYYCDPVAGPCGTGFNTTNGWELATTP